MTKISISLPDEQAQELEDAAMRQGVPAEEWLRSHVAGILQHKKKPAERAKKNTLSRALGLAKTGRPPPDDEQIKFWLHDHKVKKYGEGLIP